MKLYPPVLFMLGVFVNIALALTTVQPFAMPSEFRLVGVILIIAGVLVVRHIARRFAKAETDIRPDIAPTALLTDGLFAYTRNPIYCAMAGGLVGVSLVLGTVFGLLYVPIFIVLVRVMWIRKEERNLEARFGKAYLDYKATVGRWV